MTDDSTRRTVELFLRYWSAQDVPMSMTTTAEDVVYTLHVNDTSVPFAGSQRGHEAVSAALYQILADWDLVDYDPEILGIEGDTARVRCDFRYRHRRSGNELKGSFRLVMKVRDGLIVAADEYQDAALLEAFIRMSAGG